MSADVVFLHPPSVKDYWKRPWFPGPIARTVRALSPLFIMIPVGVLSMADRLIGGGFETKIVNLGEQALQSPRSTLDESIRNMQSRIFAIDLHWDVHSSGAIETARICKEQHPESFVLLGGLTASYFNLEIMASFPSVDGVIRGEAEESILILAQTIAKGTGLEDVPNLSYREPNGIVKTNRQSKPRLSIDEYNFTNLKLIEPNYELLNGPLRSKGWKFWNVPICRGCTMNCVTCGGSEYAYRNIFCRETPAFRSPQRVVEDFKDLDDQGINCIFLFQDCRMGPKAYYEDLLKRLHKEKWSNIESVALELFNPIDDQFMRYLVSNKPADRLSLTFSPESGSESVRYLHGRSFTNQSVLDTLSKCAENSLPIDFHFMIGLGLESWESLRETWVIWDKIMARNKTSEYFTSVDFGPMLLLDPGSIAYENPEKYGYTMLATSFTETCDRLSSPLWVDWINYETRYMTKADLVESIFQSTSILIDLYEKYGICDSKAAGVERIRLQLERNITKEVQDTLCIQDEKTKLQRLKELNEMYRDPLLSYAYVISSGEQVK